MPIGFHAFYVINACMSQAGRRLRTFSRHLGTISPTAMAKPTVGIIVIGDEILKGHTQDTNSHYLTKRLFALGLKVKKVTMVPDDIEDIATELAAFADKYTHVITTGGVGPTHDDVTFEAVARAFNDELFYHPDIVELCRKHFGVEDTSNPKLKLAHVPRSAALRYGKDPASGRPHWYPVVTVRNVVVLPGVPQLLQRAFPGLEGMFGELEDARHVEELYIRRDEVAITQVLNEVNDLFKDKVTIGSYPDFHNRYYKVKVTLEGATADDCRECAEDLKRRLSTEAVIRYDPYPLRDPYTKLQSLLSASQGTPFHDRLSATLTTVEDTLDTYSLDKLCICFNGGKDCTLLLHILHAVLQRRGVTPGQKLPALYIRRGSPFPEVELFIQQSVTRYDLDLIQINGRIKVALESLKQTHGHIAAVVMGTRHSDPGSGDLLTFQMTDTDWPEFMRVNPILEWTFSDVWRFIRELSLPYCSLYDSGYTSLGSMENTHPNPALQVQGALGVRYRPAHELADSQSERAGRN